MPRCIAILSALAVAFAAAPLAAEVVPWQANRPIDLPIEVSLPHQDHRPRLIYFPCKSVELSGEIDDADLLIRNEGNAIRVSLINPGFRTTLFVIGEDGSVFPLQLRPAASGETVDPVVQVVADTGAAGAGGEGPGAAPATAPAIDYDGEAIGLMRHMMGGERRPEVAEAPDGTMTDKGFQVGRRIYESDNLAIHCTKIFRSVNVVGYQCVVQYHGSGPRRINFQRLYFDDALCVAASKQTVMDAENPGTDIEPNEPVILWFVARAADR